MTGALGIVDRGIQQRSKRVNTWQWYHFQVSPTCPPTASVNIQPGIILPAYRYGLVQNQTYIPNQTCDFTDADNTGLDCNFTNANYYLGVILCYNGPWLLDQTTDQTFVIITDDAEYASAAEAEDLIEDYLRGYTDWMYQLFPLYAMVLKNNGITGMEGAVMPIDRIARGRSYMFRDVRPRVMMSK